MGIETELDILSPESFSDSVSDDVTDNSLITQDFVEGENDTVLPDEIQIISDDEETSENVDTDDDIPLVSVDLKDSNAIDPVYAAGSVQETERNDIPSDPEEPKSETVNTDNETLSSIYKLLDERIPDPKVAESESESESQSESESESEISLQDLKEVLENIESYESEQLSAISTVNDNIINSVNNDYHFSMVQIGLISALLGSVAINALFRKIL